MQNVEIIKHDSPIAMSILNDFFINVYSDANGKIHYSTEELSLGKEGLFSANDAIAEAYSLTVLKTDWKYLSTTSNRQKAFTQEIRQTLNDLARAIKVLRDFGELPQNYKWNEVEDAAAEILSGDRRHA